MTANDYGAPIFNDRIGAFVFKYYPLGEGTKRTTKNVPRTVARSPRDLKAAIAWLERAWIVYRNTGAWPDGALANGPVQSTITLATLGPKWLEWLREQNANGKGSESTTRGYASILESIVYRHPIAEKPLRDVTVKACASFVSDVSDGCTDNTARNRIAAVTALFTWARSRASEPYVMGIELPTNPMKDEIVRAVVPKGGSRAAARSVVLYVPKDDFEAMLAHDEPPVPAFRRVWYIVAITSGVRLGEQCGLSWAHVHLGEGRCAFTSCQAPCAIAHVHIDRQFNKNDRFEVPEKRSFRTLPLHSLAVRALQWWHDEGWRKLVGRAPETADAIFPTRDGSFNYHSNLARQLREDLGRARRPTAIEGLNLDQHALRRSFLTLLADAGIEEGARGVLAGHAAKTVTEKHYTAGTSPGSSPPSTPCA
jgi:integrase